jgi:acetyl/propionyl-CoA carboxylase alpha subunit
MRSAQPAAQTGSARDEKSSRVAIANRGEAAMRFIRAAREVGVEQGSPLTTIALYTGVERDSMFVREADEAVRIYSTGRDAYL